MDDIKYESWSTYNILLEAIGNAVRIAMFDLGRRFTRNVMNTIMLLAKHGSGERKPLGSTTGLICGANISILWRTECRKKSMQGITASLQTSLK